MMTVDRMLSAGLVFDWHEAVALTRDIVNLADAGGCPRLVPTLDAIGIGADGVTKIVGPAVFQGDPVAAAAALMGRLLGEAPCPPELRGLATLETAPPPSSLAEFDTALAYFERPGRRQLLRAVYERAEAVEMQRTAEIELARIAERARRRAEAPSETASRISKREAARIPAPAEAAAMQRIPVRAVALAAAALVALAGGAGVLGLWQRWVSGAGDNASPISVSVAFQTGSPGHRFSRPSYTTPS